MNDWELNEKSLDKSQQLQHYKHMPIIFYFSKEWQMMLNLHLVLVTLYGHFTITAEQDK